MFDKLLGIVQQVVSHIIIGKNTIVGMNTLINQSGYGNEQLRFRQCSVQFAQIFIDTRCHTETYTAFVSQKSGLHVQQVVIRGFLKVGYITLQLEFLRFQIVARIIFVRNGKRNDIQFLKIGDDVSIAAHRQHFQNAILRDVIRVLGTSLTLGYPDGLLLFRNRVVHITRHTNGRLQHLAHGKRALHGEAFIDTHQFLNPGINQQIITDSDFYGIQPLLHQKNRQETGVENDVPVIGHIGIGRLLVQHSHTFQYQSVCSIFG